MPVPLSNDLRKRIIDAKKRGDTEVTVAKEKDVSQSAVTKLWSLYRATGSYSPRPDPCGRKPLLSAEDLARIGQAVEERADITLHELKENLHLPVCISALSTAIREKLGLKFKKKRYTPANRIAKMSKSGARHGNRNSLKCK